MSYGYNQSSFLCSYILCNKNFLTQYVYILCIIYLIVGWWFKLIILQWNVYKELDNMVSLWPSDAIWGHRSGSALAQVMACYQTAVNSLWPSDAIWQQRSGSTLAQVMACGLTAPSRHLNQCWLIQCCQPYDFRSKKYSFYSWLLFTPGPHQITIMMFGKKDTFLVPFPSVESQILVGIAAFLHWKSFLLLIDVLILQI